VENSFVKKNPLQDLLSSLNVVISTNVSTKFITGQVIYSPALELVSKELNHLVAILHVYAGGLNFMK